MRDATAIDYHAIHFTTAATARGARRDYVARDYYAMRHIHARAAKEAMMRAARVCAAVRSRRRHDA